MEVIIESMLCRWNDDVTEVFLKLLDVCLLSRDETSLCNAITELKETDPRMNKNFAFGYGAAHLWVHQRPNDNPKQQLPFRLMIVRF